MAEEAEAVVPLRHLAAAVALAHLALELLAPWPRPAAPEARAELAGSLEVLQYLFIQMSEEGAPAALLSEYLALAARAYTAARPAAPVEAFRLQTDRIQVPAGAPRYSSQGSLRAAAMPQHLVRTGSMLFLPLARAAGVASVTALGPARSAGTVALVPVVAVPEVH